MSQLTKAFAVKEKGSSPAGGAAVGVVLGTRTRTRGREGARRGNG